MKLIGAELVNFACFDRQFVPLQEGLTILVGRNNMGKTAALRGLSSLQTVQIAGGKDGPPTNLAGYFRSAQTAQLELICSLEAADTEFFLKPVGSAESQIYEPWVDTLLKRGLVRWQFSLTQGGLALLRCRLEIPSPGESPKLLDIIIKTGSGYTFQVFRFPDFVPISHGGATSPPSDGKQKFDFGPKLMSPLRGLINLKLIDPHRVVQETQMLQTTTELPSNAYSLAPYLQTLNGAERKTFHDIERFVTTVFPEFRYVLPASGANNQVGIQLESRTGQKVPLSNCGTGVEQILTLATFVLTTPKPGLILLDEPHSYLHPIAERSLVQFLQEQTQHRYLISTHSSVLINSVAPDRVIYISPPGKAFSPRPDHAEMSKILSDLGYRNSDSLFYDRIIFVEGKSDKEILPILLLADGEIREGDLNRTGFPVLDGAGEGTKGIQSSILRQEKLLSAVGRTDQPRIYLFDGDRRNDEKNVISGTNSPVTNEPIRIQFLKRLEIENYLLVPNAIAIAIREELRLKGQQTEINSEDIQVELTALLSSQEELLFPRGKKDDRNPEEQIKGSRALEKIYAKYELPYHKERSGVLIAKQITARSQPDISELTKLVKPIF